MTNLFYSPLFGQIQKYIRQSRSDETIFLFVPYIKTKILAKLLDGIQNNIVIVTTWKPRDIQSGSSELELYPFCKERNMTLYVNNDIHLKVYSVGLDSAILATGNISHRGLESGGNHEAGTMIESLTIQDRMIFENIRNEARLVDDSMYEKIKNWCDENTVVKPTQVDLEEIAPAPKKDHFLISALPMTHCINDLIAGYQKISLGDKPSDNAETAACVYHDLANYGISTGLSETEFIASLTRNFFDHPFIQKIDEFIAPEAYFGRIKEWIQNNCTTVPVPSRRELTGNVQVLLEWFASLGNGKYVIDVPGAHSQRIRKIPNN